MTEKISSLLILVVEDDVLVRCCIADWLRQSGHVVIEATTGEEAIALLNAHKDKPISALFTDIQLGGQLNGWGGSRRCSDRRSEGACAIRIKQLQRSQQAGS